MTLALIKYFFIILFSFYTYMKILNIRFNLISDLLLFTFSSLFFSSLIACTNTIRFSGIFLMIIPFIIIITLRTKTEFKLSLITGIIACGISNAAFVLSIFPSAVIFIILRLDFAIFYNTVFGLFIIFPIEFAILIALFRIKRLRKGMPFLVNNNIDNAGTTICILVLYCIAVVVNNDGSSYIYILPISLISICAVYIIIWWQRWLTNTYISRKLNQEILDLRKTLEEKDAYIDQLKEQNMTLGRLIHQDNKLIPAMELAVTSMLKFHIENDTGEQSQQAQSLHADLKRLSSGRKGILDDIELQPKKLPSTGLSSIDSLFAYLSTKASAAHVSFDITVYSNLKLLTHDGIDENDLNTLLAESIENSIISSSQNMVKKLLITFEIINNAFIINFYDSGDTFDPEALINLGINNFTTRKETGGIGMGLRNIYDIVKKYKASLVIDEQLPSSGFFTKKISVRFDYKDEYILKSNRTDKLDLLGKRPDLTVIPSTE